MPNSMACGAGASGRDGGEGQVFHLPSLLHGCAGEATSPDEAVLANGTASGMFQARGRPEPLPQINSANQEDNHRDHILATRQEGKEKAEENQKRRKVS